MCCECVFSFMGKRQEIVINKDGATVEFVFTIFIYHSHCKRQVETSITENGNERFC